MTPEEFSLLLRPHETGTIAEIHSRKRPAGKYRVEFLNNSYEGTISLVSGGGGGGFVFTGPESQRDAWTDYQNTVIRVTRIDTDRTNI